MRTGLFTTLILLLCSSCGLEWGSGQMASQCDTDRVITTTALAATPAGVRSQDLGAGEVAQSFKPGVKMRLKAVSLRLLPPVVNIPALTGILTLTLDSNLNNAPADSALAVGAIPVSSVDSDDVYHFNLNTPVELLADQIYWIRLNSDYAPGTTRVVSWQGTEANPYSDGNSLYRFGTGWTPFSASRDLLFKLTCGE